MKRPKGRHPKGENHNGASLKEAQVITARRMKAEGKTYTAIISELKLPVTVTGLRMAIKGYTWKHLKGES